MVSVSDARITAAVPTYKRHDSLARTIESLESQSIAATEYEILVVDNSPDPGPGREFMQSRGNVPNLRYLYQDAPGLSKARNRALRECNTPYLAFIDDDALADGDWLAEICALFESSPDDIGVVGGPVVPIWDTPQPAWLPPDLLGFITIVDWTDEVVELGPDKWLAGTNIAYRLAATQDIGGGFREDLGRIGVVRMANDELEFTQRIRNRGWKVMYSPRIKVAHRIPAKRLTQSWIRRRNMWQGLSEAVLKGERFDDGDQWEILHDVWRQLGGDASSLRRVFEATEDPARYSRQCAAIRSLMHILFRGGGDVES